MQEDVVDRKRWLRLSTCYTLGKKSQDKGNRYRFLVSILAFLIRSNIVHNNNKINCDGDYDYGNDKKALLPSSQPESTF